MKEYNREYKKPLDSILKHKLTTLQYSVTQLGHTESAFDNEYWNFFEKGIYVDVATGEPLFLSQDKFKSSCGWPSFSRAITPHAVTYREDSTFSMKRTEVKSAIGGSHLGHVFDDGPKEKGGRRFCINSAAIKFIPFDDMEENGYGNLKTFVD
ncbi:MAG: peptide-methionine (R)-S-oxide reductase MsrB [Proteocatella sp.]